MAGSFVLTQEHRQIGGLLKVHRVVGFFDDAQSGFRQVGTHLLGEVRKFRIMFPRDDIDGHAELFEAMPERGQGAGANVLQTEGEGFGFIAGPAC